MRYAVLADICKSMNNAGYLTIDDLYTLSEKEVINKIINCEDKYIRDSFKKFRSATKVYKSDTYIDNKYITDVKAKKRYVVPLVLTENGCIRINKVSKCTNELINNYLRIPNGGYYIYFDFEFTPYERDM